MIPPNEGPRRLGLFPGSPAPTNPIEVDALLRLVPAFAFLPELDSCLFEAEAFRVNAGETRRAHLERLADPALLDRLRASLERVKSRAEAAKDNGLLFLSTTLSHFLGTVPNTEHPLIVALYCRSAFRAVGQIPTPKLVGEAMDSFEPNDAP